MSTKKNKKMVRRARFELATSCSQSRRSTRLSYTPNNDKLFNIISEAYTEIEFFNHSANVPFLSAVLTSCSVTVRLLISGYNSVCV